VHLVNGFRKHSKSENNYPFPHLTHTACQWGGTLLKNPPVGAGPNIQADRQRLHVILRQTDSLLIRFPLWLMEFLKESTSFLQQADVQEDAICVFFYCCTLWCRQSFPRSLLGLATSSKTNRITSRKME
jgi:hypothetical protein